LAPHAAPAKIQRLRKKENARRLENEQRE
jgi:hypothetical protein